jgi:F420-dependent oxidoreductase-like protein
MDLRIFTEPQQGASYAELRDVAVKAEELGFDAFFRSDHYLDMGSDRAPGPSDAWVTLAALARETSTIRLGTLMTSATFRLPGPLAISVANVDDMSGGRVELGLGAGWYEPEHTAYGIPFPDTGERFDRLEEQLAIVTGLWTTPPGERFGFRGKHYTLEESPALPKPVQSPRPPVIVGGKGKRRTPGLAARYADEFNIPFESVHFTREQFDRVRAACSDARRDPSSITYSNALVVAVGAARRSSVVGPPRSAGNRRSCASTASPGRPRRRPRPSAGTPRPERRGSTCRCSTSPTSTTSSWWRPRSSRRSADRRTPHGELVLLTGCIPWEAPGYQENLVTSPARPYSPRSRPMSSFMISLEPAQILVTRASRQARATRYSFM